MPPSSRIVSPSRRRGIIASRPTRCSRCGRFRRTATSGRSSPTWAVCPTPASSWPPTPRSSTRSRSEEHTSELQSRFDLVCRLLLEKKKKKKKNRMIEKKKQKNKEKYKLLRAINN